MCVYNIVVPLDVVLSTCEIPRYNEGSRFDCGLYYFTDDHFVTCAVVQLSVGSLSGTILLREAVKRRILNCTALYCIQTLEWNYNGDRTSQ